MYMKIVSSLLFLAALAIGIELAVLNRQMSRRATEPIPYTSVPLYEPGPSEILLDRVIPQIEIPRMPFEKAMGELDRQAHVTVFIQPGVLSEDQLQTPVSGRFKSDAVANILSSMVGQVHERPPFCSRGDMIVIGDGGELETRLYDVRPILDCSYTAPSGPLVDRDSPPDRLVDIICQTVNPDTWRDNGGSASIHYWGGILIITQTPEHHREIMRFLAKLQIAKAKAKLGETATQPVLQMP